MPDDLRTRIAAALRRHDSNMNGANPDHDADAAYGCCADAVMAVLDEAVAAMLHEYADRIDAVEPQCTALRGPYWYGQGWHQAADHLHDLADGHPARSRETRQETT